MFVRESIQVVTQRFFLLTWKYCIDTIFVVKTFLNKTHILSLNYEWSKKGCHLSLHRILRAQTRVHQCAHMRYLSTYTINLCCPSYLPTYLPTHLLVHIHSPNLSRFCAALLSLNASKLCESTWYTRLKP